jgi:hypothetical protein
MTWSRRALLAAAVLGLAGYVFVYATGRADPPIRSDGYSYYVYLPSWFIYGEAGLSSVARDCCGGEFPAFTAIIRWPGTNRWVNAHPIGVALFQTPFFLAAHGLTKWSNISPDGFTIYYQHAAGLSGLAWAVAGLFVLRTWLRRHFDEGVTTATLATLLLGTGLYHYATYDSSYSHVYSFFLFSALLYLTETWWEDRRPARSKTPVLLGLVAGLIVLTRHTNALFLLIFPLYGVRDVDSLRRALRAFVDRWRELAIIASIGALVILPQLLLYVRATGRFLVSSYGDLGFNFASPHFWGVLFSVQKGLFFWSPLLLLAVGGWMLGHRATRPFLTGALVVMLADVYLIASWWDWQFGSSYGHRGFIDTLPLFALGLASLFEWSAARPGRRTIVGGVVAAAVFLSVFQMLQYWNGVMPMADLTWDQYRSVFMRLY